MKRLKRILIFFGVLGVSFLFSGCNGEDTDVKKIRDLEFTVVEDADVPEALMETINEKKAQPFKLHYKNTDYLYIVVGYGEQPTGGYSISVDELYLTSNAIYIDTNLIGPSQDEFVSNATTYPYVVVKTEYIDKPVVFN